MVVQLEAAGGAGGAGGAGAEGGVGGAGGLKNDKILTYYYAFPAREADQLFTMGNGPKVSAGSHSGIPVPGSGTIQPRERQALEEQATIRLL